MRIDAEILIIGGGPAGLAAALSASFFGDKVVIVDDNPKLGGQIWRAELGRVKSREAKRLIERIDQVSILNNGSVFGQKNERTLLAATPKGTVELTFEKLILATGARERFLPFPHWTLPNIYGAAGLQALVKGGLSVRDKRIVVSGTGPLLLAAAESLKSKGADIVLVAEQTTNAKLARFGLRLWRQPAKILQAVSLKAKLFGVKYVTDCYVSSAAGSGQLTSVTLTRNGQNWRVDCDMLACGFHLVPNSELAALLGCKIESGFVKVDELQRTSVQNIFCAGEPTQIGGVELSLVEGKIAGLAATGKTAEARKHFRTRSKLRLFADDLNNAFALRDELKRLPNTMTIVCRCEDITFGELKKYRSFREAKLQTRCGMGSCQGRICGPAAEFLFNFNNESVRPPIIPVTIKDLLD